MVFESITNLNKKSCKFEKQQQFSISINWRKKEVENIHTVEYSINILVNLMKVREITVTVYQK